MQHQQLFTILPTELWSHVLYMLDVRDLARLRSAGGSEILPDGALFVWRATRVLSDIELAWFACARVRVALFEEVTINHSPVFPNATKYRRNGKLHRDNDLPALVSISNGRVTQSWWQDGELHRDNDLPALIVPGYAQEYLWRGKLHRPSGMPAIEYTDGRREWCWNGVVVGNSLTPDEEPVWYTPSGRRSKKGAPKWAKWGKDSSVIK
jgi:hypothetical protein